MGLSFESDRNVIVSELNEMAVSSGLVAYYTCDALNGTTLIDNSGNNNNGTNYGATVTTGISNNALSFNGTSNYASLKNNLLTVAQIRSTGSTYSAWIKPNVLGLNGRIVGLQGHNGYSDYNSGGLGITTSNVVNMICYEDPIAYRTVASSTTLNTSNWYHIVGTYNSTDKYIRLYVNGTEEGTSLLITNFSVLSQDNLSNRIGNKDHTNSFYFNGLIDEVRIYNRALSAAEVKQLYKLHAPNNISSMKEE